MAQDLFDRLTAPASLAAAWKRVRRNRGCAGGDGVGILAFAADADSRLAALHRRLADGSYRPGPLLRLERAKSGGGTRLLAIPCIADRIVQTAIAAALDRRLDGAMAAGSFAYRRGRSVEQALGYILTQRLWGYDWVVEADIARCFDSIPHAPLLARLAERVACRRTLGLVRAWLAAFDDQGRGIPQGAPVSPLLANLYLDPIDRALATKGVRPVRYADDLVLLCRSRLLATRALARLGELLAVEGLDLNRDKVRLTSFAEGFTFLGCELHGYCIRRAAVDGRRGRAERRV